MPEGMWGYLLGYPGQFCVVSHESLDRAGRETKAFASFIAGFCATVSDK